MYKTTAEANNNADMLDKCRLVTGVITEEGIVCTDTTGAEVVSTPANLTECVFGGRSYSVLGEALEYSNPFGTKKAVYDGNDMVDVGGKNVYPLGEPLKYLIPASGGLYVVGEKTLFYLDGLGPTQFVVKRIADISHANGECVASCKLSVLDEANASEADAVVFWADANNNIAISFSSGTVRKTNYNSISNKFVVDSRVELVYVYGELFFRIGAF
jgi:hypothetical protein